jgi:aminoglycoside phosphotransferase (APT) family kinase protein
VGARLARRLECFPATLLHGDAKLGNLGFGPRRLVAIDWGDLTGFGPTEIDVAWYALMNTWRIGGVESDVFGDCEAAAGHRLDPEALDLACIGSLAQMGYRLAGSAVVASRPEIRAAAATQLTWWTDKVTAALDRWGPL